MVIFLLLLVLPMFSAIDFEFKDTYKKGETLIGKISGGFIDQIGKEDITFLRGHTRVPFDYEIKKQKEEYYLYASLEGKNANNYSFTISNIRYFTEGAEVIDENLVFNFSIIDEFADFSVAPGFLETGKEFDLSIKNLQAEDIVVNLSGNDNVFSFEDAHAIKAGETKDITIDILSLGDSAIETLTLSTNNTTYEVPIFLVGALRELERSFTFNENIIKVNLTPETSINRVVSLFNDGDFDLESILFFQSSGLENYINISPEEVPLLEVGETVDIIINISSKEEEKVINGEIRAVSYNPTISTTIPIRIIISTNQSNPKEIFLTQTCEELNGSVCNIGKELCNEDSINAKDGPCCLGICEEQKKSSKGKIFGWLIVIATVLYVLWFFIDKYRKAGKTLVNILDFFKKKK